MSRKQSAASQKPAHRLTRLEKQHRIITQAFDNKLVLPPVVLKNGDKLLDSATGGCELILVFALTFE